MSKDRTVEMAQWIKHLLYRQEDLGSDPQNSCKAALNQQPQCFNSKIEVEVEETCGPACLASCRGNETLSPIRWKARTDTQGRPLISTCGPMFTHTDVYTCVIHTNTQMDPEESMQPLEFPLSF